MKSTQLRNAAAFLRNLENDPGSSNTGPWRTSVVPASAKYIAAASATPPPTPVRASGPPRPEGHHEDQEGERKAAAATHLEPMNRNAPAETNATKASVIRAR